MFGGSPLESQRKKGKYGINRSVITLVLLPRHLLLWCWKCSAPQLVCRTPQNPLPRQLYYTSFIYRTHCGLLAKGANFNLLSSSRISRTWKKSAAGSYHWQLAYQDLLETWSERLRKVKASSHLPCSLCVQASTYTQYLFLQARGSLWKSKGKQTP